MIYHVASSKEVIAKLHRDLRLTADQNHLDAIEWFGEALGLIGGTPATDILKEKVLVVANYTSALPAPLNTLLGVLHPVTVTQLPGETVDNYHARILLAPSSGVERAGGLQPAFRNRTGNEESYTLNPGFIQVSFETGFLIVLYKAPPVDAEGYPMIPDHASYRQALFYYALMQMTHGGYKHSVLGFGDIENRWLKYCTQARNASAYPDLAMMERLRDIWVRVNPDFEMFSRLFERDVHRAGSAEPYGR